MLPFYIYYSMFGFQRVGDAIWAAADQRARGFLLGATSGRTTLAGEGLQHQDGSSHLVAATIPNCKSYDPAFAGELAIIVDAGMREMLIEQNDVFYYITLMNENYAQPDLPQSAYEGVLKGGYLHASFGNTQDPRVTLMGSGAILTEVIQAARQLAEQCIGSDVISVTSWSELARDAESSRQPHLHQILKGTRGPVIAASDYVKAVPEALRAHLPQGRTYATLGTDGFGRSDTRCALRRFFNVDAQGLVGLVKTTLKVNG
jgi:pyruvate dehydrogenase E1 component